MVKFGVYDDDLPVFALAAAGRARHRRCFEAQVMDLADDVAYSVHDVEDGVAAGRIDLSRLDRPAVCATARAWYLPDADDAVLGAVLDGLVAVGGWPSTPYDGSRRALATLKNLTSDLIGRFCGSVQSATFASADGPFARHAADLVVPEQVRLEMGLLKGIAAHYVMQAEDRVAARSRERELLAALVEVLADRAADVLERPFADDWDRAGDDAARRRVVVDQVASLTDASAVAWHHRLVDQGRSPWG